MDIVVKGSKVLDYMITLTAFHILICCLFEGLDYLNWKWLAVNGLWCLVTTLCGEYVCIRFEQQEIRILERLFKAPQHKYKKTDKESKINIVVSS